MPKEADDVDITGTLQMKYAVELGGTIIHTVGFDCLKNRIEKDETWAWARSTTPWDMDQTQQAKWDRALMDTWTEKMKAIEHQHPHIQWRHFFMIVKVTRVEHFTDTLFKIRTERPNTFRFRAGEFVMIGFDNWSEKLQKNKPIMRAYSLTSGPYDEFLEFYSIKVPDGPLTSKLQHIKVGDEVIVGEEAYWHTNNF